MDTYDRKLKQRIARRKEKVERMIGEQEAVLATLDPMIYQCQQDYLQALSKERNKLYRLKQELLVLKSGRLLQDV